MREWLKDMLFWGGRCPPKDRVPIVMTAVFLAILSRRFASQGTPAQCQYHHLARQLATSANTCTPTLGLYGSNKEATLSGLDRPTSKTHTDAQVDSHTWHVSHNTHTSAIGHRLANCFHRLPYPSSG